VEIGNQLCRAKVRRSNAQLSTFNQLQTSLMAIKACRCLLSLCSSVASPRQAGANNGGRNAIFRGGLGVSDEALAPLAEQPAIARIDTLGAKLPETGS
jgi:hypothetical protein